MFAWLSRKVSEESRSVDSAARRATAWWS